MAKIRDIKPEFFDDEILGTQCSRDTRLLYECTWCQADDYGNVRGAPRHLRLKAFPYDDDLDDLAVAAMLAQLEGTRPDPRIIGYEVDGQRYFHIVHLYRHLSKRERDHVQSGKAISRCPSPPADVISITYGDDDSIVQHRAASCGVKPDQTGCLGLGLGSGLLPLALASGSSSKEDSSISPTLAHLRTEEGKQLLEGDTKIAARRKLFIYWCNTWGKTGGTQFSKGRDAALTKAQKHSTNDEIAKAIKGSTLDTWKGRSEGKNMELKYLVTTREDVEKYIALAEGDRF